jgi:hypothetical protein
MFEIFITLGIHLIISFAVHGPAERWTGQAAPIKYTRHVTWMCQRKLPLMDSLLVPTIPTWRKLPTLQPVSAPHRRMRIRNNEIVRATTLVACLLILSGVMSRVCSRHSFDDAQWHSTTRKQSSHSPGSRQYGRVNTGICYIYESSSRERERHSSIRLCGSFLVYIRFWLHSSLSDKD